VTFAEQVPAGSALAVFPTVFIHSLRAPYANSQVAVYLTYASSKGHALIDRALYLPAFWTEDRDRLDQAGVPKDVAFATKPALAQALIADALDESVRPGGRHFSKVGPWPLTHRADADEVKSSKRQSSTRPGTNWSRSDTDA
jgi:hypothetical protein